MRWLVCLMLVTGCVRSLPKVDEAPPAAEPPPPPEIPVIAFARTAVSAGRSDYAASVETPREGETYVWSIANGRIVSGQTSSAATFEPAALGVVILTVTASNAVNQSVATSLSIPVIAPPPEAPPIDVPARVTEQREDVLAFTAQPQVGAVYEWTLVRDGLETVLGVGEPAIRFSAASVGTMRLRLSARNEAGDRSLTPSEVSIDVVPRGTELIAGHIGGEGWADGTGALARLDASNTSYISASPNGDVRIPEYDNSRVRLVRADGTVTSIAGGGDLAPTGPTGVAFPAASVLLNGVTALRPAGPNLDFLIDNYSGNCLVRLLAEDSGAFSVTTILDAYCSCDDDDSDGAVMFGSPEILTSDGAGHLYVASGYAIFRVDLTGAVELWAGTCSTYGVANDVRTNAQFWDIISIGMDGADVVVADAQEPTVLRRIPQSGSTSTLPLPAPLEDSSNMRDFVVRGDHTVFTPLAGAVVSFTLGSTGVTGVFGGTAFGPMRDGIGSAASLDVPYALTLVDDDTLVFIDDGETLRRATLSTGAVTTIAGAPGVLLEDPPDLDLVPASLARVWPGQLRVRSDGTFDLANIFVGPTSPARLERYAPAASGGYERRIIAGTPNGSIEDGYALNRRLSNLIDFLEEPDGSVTLVQERALRTLTPGGFIVTLAQPVGSDSFVAATRLKDGTLIVAKRAFPNEGTLQALVGSGMLQLSGDVDGCFELPCAIDQFVMDGVIAIATGPDDTIYAVERGRRRLLAFDLQSFKVTFVAGSEEPGGAFNQATPCAAARFENPGRMVFDGRHTFFIADEQRIHKVSLAPTCVVDTLTLDSPYWGVLLGQPPRFNTVASLGLTRAGDLLVGESGESSVFLFRW